MHHAFIIEAGVEEGITTAEVWIEKELGMKVQSNPDVVVLRYGLFSVADARKVFDLAIQAPFRGESKALIIAASRAYHEAQNALLKLFEEPPPNTYLFLILPSLGGLLPTLRSRVQILEKHEARSTKSETNLEIAKQFIKMSPEKRSAMIKKLASGKDEEERRSNRDEAIALVNGIERVLYEDFMSGRTTSRHRELLEDIQTLRGYLYDRSAPVRMILEHLSLVLPEELGRQ